MKIITTRDIIRNSRQVFEEAENERILIKRGKKYVLFMVSEKPDQVYVDKDWLELFFEIPSQYRVNPFLYSASGDLFFADKRNVEKVQKAADLITSEKTKKLSPEDQKILFETK